MSKQGKKIAPANQKANKTPAVKPKSGSQSPAAGSNAPSALADLADPAADRLSPEKLLQLQQSHGNRFVQRYLARHASDNGQPPVARPGQGAANGHHHGSPAATRTNGSSDPAAGLPPVELESDGAVPDSQAKPAASPPNGQADFGGPAQILGPNPLQMLREALQRQNVAEDEPTPAEKAAAQAAAAAAESMASQAAATGREETAKSQTQKSQEKQGAMEAAQKAAASQAGPAAGPAAGLDKEALTGKTGMAAKTPGKKEPGKAAMGKKGAGAAVKGAASGMNGAGPAAAAGPEAKAPTSPEEDPAFQSVVSQVKDTAKKEQSHDPATKKAGEAQAAAESPPGELASKAQANQVGKMEQAETPGFNAAAFKAQLMQRIQALAPKTAKEADNFKSGNKLGGLKGEMQGKVSQEKDKSTGKMEAESKAPPDQSGVTPKAVTPLESTQAGPAPEGVGAQQAVPKQKSQAEVEAPLKEESKQVDDPLKEADITEEQLEKANEPEFESALKAKKEAQAHAEEAPKPVRQHEQERIGQATGEAETMAQEKIQGMHGSREQVLNEVSNQQGQTKSQDEQARDQVAGRINQIYDETKTKVDQILTELDGSVEKTFDAGAAAAKVAFENFVDAKMKAYKERRYGGWLGWAKWAKDKLLGMPGEVNAFYQQGRGLYLQKMDAVIDTVVAQVEKGLKKAKAEVASGRKRIDEYVAGLPKELQQVGSQAAEQIGGKFDQLEQNIENKQSELIDKLAQKYNENLQAIDARIEELKAANKGLVQKAMDAVVGVVKTILKIKDMLMSVLASAASAIGKIIKNPIGFLKNLIGGVKQGLANFVKNIGTHLKKGLMTWLFGEVAKSGIELPTTFDLKGILTLVMQILGMTWQNIRNMAVKKLGEPIVSGMEKVFEIFRVVKEQGLGGLFEFVKGMLGNLKEMVVDAIKDMVITQVIQAGIQWLMGILGGPAGAFIKAAKAIYDIVMWFVNNGKQLMSLVQAIIKSITAIASGAVGQAAQFIEQSLAKAIPVVIGFLASLLGLGNLGEKIKKIIKMVQAPVKKIIGWVLEKAVGFAKKVGGMLGFGKKGKKGDDPTKGQDTKQKTKEQEKALKAIETEEKKYLKDGGIEREAAQKTAQSVKSKYPVFKTLTVADGNDTWDYQYVFRAKSKKTPKNRVKIELKRPKRFWFSTRMELKQRFPGEHKKSHKKKALVKKGLARRHIIASKEIIDNLKDNLNGKLPSSAAKMLEQKGVTVDRPLSNKNIQKAAKKLLRMAFNDADNLWVGDGSENSSKQAARDRPPGWTPQKEGALVRNFKKKYLL